MAVYIKELTTQHATPMTHARILYDDLCHLATITADSTADGFFTDALKYPTTYEAWKPDADTSELTFDFGAAKDIDAVLIAAHNIGAVGATITIKPDNDSDNDVSITPTDNSPIMVLWDTNTPINTDKLTIEVEDGQPVIAVIMAGKALVMPRPMFNDHSPTELNRSITITNEKSINGQALGFQVRRQGASTQYDWQNVSRDFIYGDYMPFKDYAETGRGFFGISWRPSFTANSIRPAVQYGSLSGALKSTITGNPDYFNISMGVDSAGAIR